jgi:NAD(P)-dependent dehydrogenase (short-subunit alcohol dehydrogenase family)
MTLTNKKVLVTGGGSGIGQATAWALAEAGCEVVVAGRREAALRETVSQAPAGKTPHFHTVDVSQRESVQSLVQWSTEQLGQIDILVHAAGVNIKTRSMLEMRPEQWDEVMAINASGTYNCLWAVLPQMRERSDGLFINISSIAGKRAADLGGIAYCASKFASTGLATAAGLEEARRGIRITNVYPGEVDTPILEQRPQPVSDEHRQRILHAEDVAHIVLAIAQLPPRAHVPEVVIKPLSQNYA